MCGRILVNHSFIHVISFLIMNSGVSQFNAKQVLQETQHEPFGELVSLVLQQMQTNETLLTRKMELESSSRPVWRSRPSLPFVSASHSKGKMLRHFKEKLCSAHWERALFYEIILDARLIFRSLLEVSVAASS